MSDGDKAYSYLVVGLLNGDVVVWQFNAVTMRSKKCDVQPQILLQFETKLHNITTLHWRAIDSQTGTSSLYSDLITLLIAHTR
jgi:hypothetical protein